MKKINLKTTIWITAAVLAFVVLSTDVMAQRGQRNANRPGNGLGMMQQKVDWEPGQRCFNRLDLTEAQQEQMKTMRIKQMEQMLPFKNAMQEKKAKLQTLRSAKNADMKAINKLIDEMADLKADQMKAREAHHQEVRSILSDEQRILFDSFKGNNDGRGGQGKGQKQGKRGLRFGCGMGR